MLTLGTLTLDSDPYISQSYEYSQSSNGKIVGGTKKITLTGSIVANSASILILKSNEITEWFSQQENRYLSGITIDNQTYEFLYVDNVSIDSDDWVTSVNYTINLVAQIENTYILPSNIVGITNQDYVSSFDITENLELSSDNQNSFYMTSTGLKTIENSVKWNITLSLSCRRTATKTAIQNAHELLTQILISTPDRAEFNEYKSWTLYLQSRSLNTNPVTGSLSFTCRAILFPDTLTIPAFINIQSSENHNHTNNSHNRNITLNSNGLVPINWSSIVDVSEFCLTSKINNAKTALNTLIDIYDDIAEFPGQSIDPTNPSCQTDCNVQDTNVCYRPKNITTTHNLTDGRSSATLEWSSENTSCSNGLSIEIEVTENLTDRSIVEQSNFTIAKPIIVDLNCNKAQTKQYNINVTSKYSCPQDNLRAEAEAALGGINPGNSWYKIRHTTQQNNNSYTISVEYVKGC